MPGGIRVYPAADLLDWLGCEINGDAADLLGVSTATVVGWKRRHSRFTEAEAERFAGRCRAHPCEIWPELWWLAAPEAI